jgi:hypothetical protein
VESDFRDRPTAVQFLIVSLENMLLSEQATEELAE